MIRRTPLKTSEPPIIVTRQDIELFEQKKPHLRGIGEIMLRRGKWKLAEPEEGNGAGREGST